MVRRSAISALAGGDAEDTKDDGESDSLLGHVRTAGKPKGTYLVLEMSPTKPTIEFGPKKREFYQEVFYTLHQAARNGETKITELLINKLSPDTKQDKIDELDEGELAPLHYAARYNHYKVVQVLLDYGANINVRGKNQVQALHLAARYNKASRKLEHFDTPQESIDEDTVIGLLLEYSGCVNCKDIYGMTPLHYAAIRGNEQGAEELLNHPQIDIELGDKQKMRPIHLAAMYNQPEIVSLLIKSGSSLSVRDEDNSTPLHKAALTGNMKIVQMMIDWTEFNKGPLGVDQLITSKDNNFNTPLHCAVDMGHLDIAHLLLERNCPINEPRERHVFPLHIAAASGNKDIVKLLLENNAIVNCKNESQETPLHKAAEFNHSETIKILIENGAKIEARDNEHMTPLLTAAFEGHTHAIDTLLSLNASSDVTDKNDKSALYLAVQENHPEALKIFLKHSNGKTLINKPDRQDNTPIHIAAQYGYKSVTRILLDHKASLDCKNEEELTPLHLAAKFGHFNIINIILDCKKNLINIDDEYGNTPLHLAAAAGHRTVVQKLLNSGACVEDRNCYQWTALDCAASAGWVKTAQVLLLAGSPIDPLDKTKTTPLHLAAEAGHAHVVDLLLDLKADPTLLDEHGNNCLDLAIMAKQKDAVMAIIESNSWLQVFRNETFLEKFGPHQTPFRKLIHFMPDVAEDVLRKFIEISPHSRDDPDYNYTLNFEFLDDSFISYKVRKCPIQRFAVLPTPIPSNDDSLYSPSREFVKSNHPLMLMANSRPELLGYPVCISLLEHKWKHFGRYVYYGNLTFYLLFLTFLTCYVLTATPPCHPEFFFNSTDDCCLVRQGCPGKMRKKNDTECTMQPSIAFITKYFILCLTLIHLLKEMFQMYQNRWNYFNLENFVEWCCYISALLFVLDFDECSLLTGIRMQWQWELGAFAVFLAWMVLVMFISKFPFIGIYVVMVLDILDTFARFSIVFILFIVAFAMSFFVLLQNQDPFEGILEAIVKTSVMMIGEIEYDAIFNDPEENPLFFRGSSFILFVIFLILMSIIVMNLLVGLAVDDIKGVQEQALQKRFTMQVELVLSVESLLPTWLRKKFVMKRKTVFPNMMRPYEKFINKFWKVSSNELVYHSFKPSIEHLFESQGELAKEVETLKSEVNYIKGQNKKIYVMLSTLLEQLNIKEDYSRLDSAEEKPA